MADVELVIKIPSEVYENIKSATADDDDISSLLLGMHEATPLPKGHKRLIEDNFKVGPVFDEEGNLIGYQHVTQEDLNNALTIIEADIGN